MAAASRETALLLAFGLSGMASLTYEVVWTRLMILVFGTTVYAISTILTAFIAGLALGSYYVGRKIGRYKNVYLAFGLFELGIGIYGLVFPQLLPLVQYPYLMIFQGLGDSFVLFQTVQVLMYIAMMIIPTFLMGTIFPLLSKAMITDVTSSSKKVGFLYSSNSIGSMVGPLISGFMLIPLIGLRYTSLVASILNVSLGLVFLIVAAKNWKALIAIPLSLLALSAGFVAYQSPLRMINFYYISIFNDVSEIDGFLNAQETVFYKEGLYSTVEVVKIGQTVSLKIDGRADASTSPRDMSHQLLVGYLPTLLHKDPKEVLNIGLGGGFTLGALKTLGVKVDTVEIDQAVIEANEKIFYVYNNDALRYDKLTLHLADARNFLVTSDKKWDLIISEPSNPVTSSVNHLFTKEFFVLAKQHLNKGGMLAQWFPNDLTISEREYKIILHTLLSEFPYVTIWDISYGKRLFNTIMIASLEPHSMSIERFPNIGVVADMDKIGINSPLELNARLVCDPKGSQQFAKDAQMMNLDDLPIIEFLVPRNYFGEGKILRNICSRSGN